MQFYNHHFNVRIEAEHDVYSHIDTCLPRVHQWDAVRGGAQCEELACAVFGTQAYKFKVKGCAAAAYAYPHTITGSYSVYHVNSQIYYNTKARAHRRVYTQELSQLFAFMWHGVAQQRVCLKLRWWQLGVLNCKKEEVPTLYGHRDGWALFYADKFGCTVHVDMKTQCVGGGGVGTLCTQLPKLEPFIQLQLVVLLLLVPPAVSVAGCVHSLTRIPNEN